MTSTVLYELVHSLSKNEIGYITKYWRAKGGKYLELFNLIVQQQQYNEKQLKQQFKGTYIERNFSFAKNYLYHSILKILIQYRAKNKDAYYHFSVIKILYTKGLYEQCAKMLKKTVKQAKQKNDYLSLLRSIQYVKLLMHSDLHSDSELNSLLVAEPTILEKQQILSTYQSLLAEVKTIRLKGVMKGGGGGRRIKEITKHPYLKSEQFLIDSYCKQMYHEILFLAGLLLKNMMLIKRHAEALQQFISEPQYSNITNYQKIDLLKQIIRFSILSSNYSSVERNIYMFRFLLDTSNDVNISEKIAAYSYLYTFQTDLYLKKNRINELADLFEEMNVFVNKFGNRLPIEFFLVMNANRLVYYFIIKDYENVVLTANDILINNKHGIRKDITITVMLSEIVALYELSKVDLFESRLIAFKRFLAKYKIAENIWNIFTEFLMELLNKDVDIKEKAQEVITQLQASKSSSFFRDLHFLIEWLRIKSEK